MTVVVLLLDRLERQQTQLHLRPALHNAGLAARHKLQVGVSSCSWLSEHRAMSILLGLCYLPKRWADMTSCRHLL